MDYVGDCAAEGWTGAFVRLRLDGTVMCSRSLSSGSVSHKEEVVLQAMGLGAMGRIYYWFICSKWVRRHIRCLGTRGTQLEDSRKADIDQLARLSIRHSNDPAFLSPLRPVTRAIHRLCMETCRNASHTVLDCLFRVSHLPDTPHMLHRISDL